MPSGPSAVVAVLPGEARREEVKGLDLWARDSAQGQCEDKPWTWAGKNRVGNDPSARVLIMASFSSFNQTGTLSFVSLDVLLAGELPEAGTACDASLHIHAPNTNNTPGTGLGTGDSRARAW